MSRARHAYLPSLKIPSEPPKFIFKVSKRKQAPSSPEKSEEESENEQQGKDPAREKAFPDRLPPLVIRPTCSGVRNSERNNSMLSLFSGVHHGEHNGNTTPNLCGAINTSSIPVIGTKTSQDPKPYKHYETSNWMQLLVSGQLPPSLLEDLLQRYLSKGKKTKSHSKKEGEKYYSYKSMRKRETQLWEPKKVRLQANSQIDKNLLEARCRQKEQMAALTERIDCKTKQREQVLLKKAETMDDRVESYLNKMEKRTKGFNSEDLLKVQMGYKALREAKHVENLNELMALRRGLFYILKKKTKLLANITRNRVKKDRF